MDTRHLVLSVATAAALALPAGSPANAQEAPATSATSAGMSTDLSTGPTSQQLEMMQVRQAAREAQDEAATAAMVGAADAAAEERRYQSTLEAAREKKRIKREALTQLKWQKAQTAYDRVSANEMESWRDGTGGIRVERNVPNEFLLALREEEAAIAAREMEEAEGGDRGFTPLRSAGRAASGVAGGVSGVAGGVLGKLPFGKRNSTTSAEPQPASSPAPQSQPRTAAPPTVNKPGSVPRISGAALVDGRSQASQGGRTSSSTAASSPASSPPVETPEFEAPASREEKKGLFSFMKTNDSGGSGGLFSKFGKKRSSAAADGIDGSLFPEGSSGSVSAGSFSSAASSSAQDLEESSGETFSSAAPSSSVDLPTHEAEQTRRGGGFSLPKPRLSVPKFGGSSGESGGRNTASANATSVVNSSGHSYYVVTQSAQYMQYGASQMESEIRSLPAGSVVQMTKPGADWVGIRSTDGSEGVVQSKYLRPASESEIPGGF